MSFNSSRSSAASFFRRLIKSWGSSSSLTVALFLMCATRCANLHVEMLSSMQLSSTAAVPTITVLQLPPSESRSTEVIVEFLYGTCVRYPCDRSCNATITCSRWCKDKLMYLASFCKFPSTPVFEMRSLPAKSTRCSFARRTLSLSCFLESTQRMNMQWLRVDASFIGVSATTLFVSPRKSRLRASSSFCAIFTDKFRKWMLPSSSSRSCTLGRSSSFLVPSSPERRS
mmetsp:Transcript_44569/g.123473  ORF Transcript_44569/g.123473 Transcript_44569/m.123473 type:complete len:228 (+) Transcript_44569:1678-2361(+)